MVEPAHVPVWLDAAAAGRLRLRLRANLDTFETNRARVKAEAGQSLTARTVKFYADGVVESGTAALLEPCTDCPASHGMANWTPEELAAAPIAVDELGFQVHIHAIGDAGIRLALDAIAGMTHRNGPRDRRPTIAHLQLIDPSDLPRIADLGVVATFSPLRAQPEPLMVDLTLPRLGPERGGRQYQIRGVLESGATVSFGSDLPVTDYRPLSAIATAVTRQMRDGVPPGGWLPEERVNLTDALRAYTVGAAFQAFEDHSWGRIERGMRADLVQLSHDPMLVAPIELREVQVVSTWLGGVRTA
jgi:predicted amidohydrolase YtcJ